MCRPDPITFEESVERNAITINDKNNGWVTIEDERENKRKLITEKNPIIKK